MLQPKPLDTQNEEVKEEESWAMTKIKTNTGSKETCHPQRRCRFADQEMFSQSL